jgi:hypothetical protein
VLSCESEKKTHFLVTELLSALTLKISFFRGY